MKFDFFLIALSGAVPGLIAADVVSPGNTKQLLTWGAASSFGTTYNVFNEPEHSEKQLEPTARMYLSFGVVYLAARVLDLQQLHAILLATLIIKLTYFYISL